MLIGSELAEGFLEDAACRVQSLWRGAAARKVHIINRLLASASRAQRRQQASAIIQRVMLRHWTQVQAKRFLGALRGTRAALADMQAQREAAEVLQAMARGRIAFRRYGLVLTAVRTLQRRVRRRRFLAAVATVQSWVRLQWLRRAAVRRVAEERERVAAEAARVAAEAVRVAAETARLAAEAAVVEAENARAASALTIQRTWRGSRGRILAKCRLAAVVQLQAQARGLKARRALACLRRQTSAAVTLQKLVRGHRAAAAYGALRRAVLVLQCRLRLRIHRKTLRAEEARALRCDKAAVTLQAQARRMSAQRAYRCLVVAVVSLQRAARRQRRVRRAVVIQSGWRMGHCRRRFVRARSGMVALQGLFRQRLAAVEAEKAAAAVTLQRVARGNAGRQVAVTRQAAVRTLQAFVRHHRQRLWSADGRAAWAVVNAWTRVYRGARDNNPTVRAVVAVQQGFRRRRLYKVVRIQTFLRGALGRVRVERARQHAAEMQVGGLEGGGLGCFGEV
jgi:hypothetical protein